MTSEAGDLFETLQQHLTNVAGASAVRLVTVPQATHVQQRVTHEGHELLFERASHVRTSAGVPFWEATFMASEAMNDGLPPDLAHQARFHQTPQPVDGPIPIDMRLAERLRSAAEAAGSGEMLALSSLVAAGGGTLHLPMLDFGARSTSEGGLGSVRVILRELGWDGLVLSSGRSYHFYGRDLLTFKEYAAFLGEALLFAPLVDGRWIAHQLIGQSSALRISRGRDGTFPRVVTKSVLDA